MAALLQLLNQLDWIHALQLYDLNNCLSIVGAYMMREIGSTLTIVSQKNKVIGEVCSRLVWSDLANIRTLEAMGEEDIDWFEHTAVLIFNTMAFERT